MIDTTLANCVFDFEDVLPFGVRISMTNCIVVLHATSLAEYGAMTGNPTATRTRNQSPLPSATPISGNLFIKINCSQHEPLRLRPGASIELVPAAYPIIVAIASISGFDVRVYNHVNELVGLFTELDGSIAVHFSTSSSLGRVAISTDIDCECEYFAIDCICPEFVISTLPSEAFTGSTAPSSGNGLTLSNWQDACLFYLSSSWITSWSDYSTDEGDDYLQFGEGRMVRKFTETGSSTRTSQHFAKLSWHLDEIVVLTSFSVRMTSGEPHLRSHPWIGGNTSSSPIILSGTITYTHTPTRSQTVPVSIIPPSSIEIGVNETSYKPISVDAGQQLVMSVSGYPIFVIIPSISDLSAIVYDSNNVSSRSFAAPTKAFAVYFSESCGHITFTASSRTALKYFAMKLSFPCRNYHLSSSPNVEWTGTRSEGNFTIGNSQDICFLHVSDNVTDVTVNYITE
jgi:hypothetical protein